MRAAIANVVCLKTLANLDPQNINKHTQAVVGYTDTKGTVYNETQTNTGCETQWDTNERYGMVYNQTLPVNCKYEIFLTLCRQFVAFFFFFWLLLFVCFILFCFFSVVQGWPSCNTKVAQKGSAKPDLSPIGAGPLLW